MNNRGFSFLRGKKTQKVVISNAVTIGRDCTDTRLFVPSNTIEIPMGCRDLSDVLVAYSTLPGHVAHRDRLTGSWYIQTLCEVFMNHAHNTELIDLLRMVCEFVFFSSSSSILFNICTFLMFFSTSKSICTKFMLFLLPDGSKAQHFTQWLQRMPDFHVFELWIQ